MNQNVFNLLDWFIPESIRLSEHERDNVRKYRLLLGFIIFNAVIWFSASLALQILIKQPTPQEIGYEIFFMASGLLYFSFL